MAQDPTSSSGGGCAEQLGCLGMFVFALLAPVILDSSCRNKSSFNSSAGLSSGELVPFASPTPNSGSLPAPQYMSFRVAAKPGKGKATPQPYAVVFAYDEVKVISVGSISDIPDDARKEAIRESGRQPSFLRELTRDTVHIVEGAVDITVGDLFATDELSVRLATNQGNIEKLSLVLSQLPRGPPNLHLSGAGVRAFASALLTETERRVQPMASWPRAERARPLRTIYVLGAINDFKGPDQYKNSVLNAEVVDLGPRGVFPKEGVLIGPKHRGYERIAEQRAEPGRIEPEVWAASVAAGIAVGGYSSPRGGIRPGTGQGPSKPYDSERSRPYRPQPRPRPRPVRP